MPHQGGRSSDVAERQPPRPVGSGVGSRELLLAAAVAAALAPQLAAGAAAAPQAPVSATLPAPDAGGGLGLRPEQVVLWSGERLLERLPANWQQLRGPIGTVCVTGDDRVGKSTLLTLWGRNLTEAEDFAFPVGHARASHTKGLWSAILPAEVTGLDYHLNLCDSQGLKQLPELEQWRLFSANVLIPSVLVYMLIDVVQNDQLRDLARMAQQFQRLSSEDRGSFGRLMSPHLIVVVREESDLDSDGGGEAGCSLGAHLEEALSGPGFAEDKALIRHVFQTREAWALRELPLEARRALRAGGSGLEAGSLAATGGGPWRASGEAVLERVLEALDRGLAELPRGGPELNEWYRSVLQTVNSHEDGSMGRLIGHSERLAAGQRRRRLLQEWRGPVFAALATVALLLAFGGCLGRWLDRTAWCTWIVLCICYIGTSPLVTMPLSGIIPKYCNQLAASGGTLLRLTCQEASAHTAAMLLAVVLGALSYPMLTAQLQWLLGLFPVPGSVRRSGAACTLAGAIGLLLLLQDAGLGDAVGEEGSSGPLAVLALLASAAVLAGVELALKVRHNHRCRCASESGRGLHFYVAKRLGEVQSLQDSREWARYYHRHPAPDALWRYRCVPVWRPTAVCSQACSLLAWAWLIYPHCDLVLAAGVLANGLHFAWRLSRALLRCARRRRGPVAQWFEELEEASSCSGEEDEQACIGTPDDSNAASGCERPSSSSSVPGAGGPSPTLLATGGGVPTASSCGAPGREEPRPGAFSTPPPAYRSRQKSMSCSARRSSTPGSLSTRRRTSPPHPPMEESAEEQQQRAAIEEMRRAQERHAAWVNG